MKLRTISALVIWVASASAIAFETLPKTPLIPADNPMSKAKIELGAQLFFDARLSKDNTVSCNSCHDVTKAGVDNLSFSKGVGGQLGGRNAPTVWNSAFLSVQFWDGRANSLEDQAKGPLINPVEMAMPDHVAVMEKVKGIKGYVTQFEKVFGKKDALTIDNLAKAIAAYERTLIAADSPFDGHIKGDKKAMTAEAVEGMTLFQTTGCVACHQGPNFAGPQLPIGTGFYMRFPNFPGNEYDKKYAFSKDLGRFDVTKDPAHKNMFRVPTLRNIELTGPYFHNGAVKELDEAVRVMAKSQLNKDLTNGEVEKLVAFLKSLTSKFPAQKPPALPN